MMTGHPDVLDTLEALMARKGGDLYGGECVTQLQHALQAANLAEQDGKTSSIVVAALLHDIGHLFEPEFERALMTNEDHRHEKLGDAFLKRFFGAEVTEPVRLHVAAKRYLCATRPDYFGSLSPASVHSLKLQGGPMSDEEVAQFEAEPHFAAAVDVRLYDDLAKDPDARTPDLAHFFLHVRKVAQ
ncbi:MAG: HD domain-containing protein [Hyphomicrobiaceae bacterium]